MFREPYAANDVSFDRILVYGRPSSLIQLLSSISCFSCDDRKGLTAGRVMACNYHRRHMKQMAEAKASESSKNADEVSNLPEQLNHDEWNPNQIVYRKVGLSSSCCFKSSYEDVDRWRICWNGCRMNNTAFPSKL